jgi:hypothetical protein
MSARSWARLWGSALPAELCWWEAERRWPTAGARRSPMRDGGVLPVAADLLRLMQPRVREPVMAPFFA